MSIKILSSGIAFALLAGGLMASIAGCSDDATALEPVDGYNGANPDGSTPIDPASLTCVGRQVVYTGFTGRDGKPESLVAGREELPVGIDRARLKPFSALIDEYHRVLDLDWKNNKDDFITLIFGSAATFGDAPARWFTEPTAGAVSFYQGYRIAFEGCGKMLAKDAKFKNAPTNESAAAECSTMARKFWSRTPNPEEIDECVKVAMVDSLKETTPTGQKDTTPERRWAYACTSLLASAGFVSY